MKNTSTSPIRVTPDELYHRMKFCLASPPSQAGVAIKSEPALARMVGLKRPTVRKVIDALVDEGILVRRNGSGTYVRKVPPKIDLPSPEEASWFPGESLFNISEKRQHRREPLHTDKVIRIGTVIDLTAPHPSSVYKRIFDGLSARAGEIGAIVEVHPLAKFREEKDAKTRIRKALKADNYDGLIISSSDNLVLDIVSRQKHRPVVYLDFANRDWNLPTELVPMVSFDLRHAMINAIKRLYTDGHSEIALVGYAHGPERATDQKEDELLYDYVMSRLGATFRGSAFLTVDNVRKNERHLNQLFGKGSSCTAVYFCDDVALMQAYPVLLKLGIRPGENLAVISHSNKGIDLPRGPKWSRMEFDPLQVASLVLDSIVAEMRSALPDIISLAHKPTWIEGESHRFAGGRGGPTRV